MRTYSLSNNIKVYSAINLDRKVNPIRNLNHSVQQIPIRLHLDKILNIITDYNFESTMIIDHDKIRNNRSIPYRFKYIM